MGILTRRARSRIGVLIAVITGVLLLAGAAFAITMWDLSGTAGKVEQIDEAIYQGFQPTDPTGSGNFFSFVRISANT